jgi:hypothetical protein
MRQILFLIVAIGLSIMFPPLFFVFLGLVVVGYFIRPLFFSDSQWKEKNERDTDKFINRR